MLNNSTRRGKHKIFIGMSPGVGKTYRMLHEAHRLKAEGIKVSCNVHERILLCISTYINSLQLLRKDARISNYMHVDLILPFS